MKNLAFAVIDRLIVVAHGCDEPTDEEWAAYLLLVAGQGVDRTMQLVWTRGGRPTRAQRRALEHIVAGRTVPVAVVSPSARVRGTVTVLSWFHSRLSAFPPARLRAALAFLEIPKSRAERIERELGKLCLELDGALGGS